MTLLSNAIAAALAAMATPVIQQGPLTIDQAVAIAEHNAFAIQLQASNVEISRQRISQARASMGPRVVATGTYLRNSEQITSQQGDQSFVVQPIDQRTANVSLSWPLDVAGNLSRRVDAAKENYAASQHTLAATVSDVRLRAKTSYFNVLRQVNLVQVAQQAVADADEQLKQGRQLYEGQQIALIDVQRFEAQLKGQQTALAAARNNLELARQQFNLALAQPIEAPVELQQVNAMPETPGDSTGLVEIAQTQRPEILALQESIKALAHSRRATESGMNPTLNLGIQHNRNLGTVGFGGAEQQTYGTLTLSIPLYDSGLTRAQVKEARQLELQAQINLNSTKLSISQEVLTALANLSGAKDRLSNAEVQVKLAEEVFRLSKVRQEAGAGTYVEVIDAETLLVQARNDVVSARYDYLAAYAQLQRAVGHDSLKLTSPGSGATK